MLGSIRFQTLNQSTTIAKRILLMREAIAIDIRSIDGLQCDEEDQNSKQLTY